MHGLFIAGQGCWHVVWGDCLLEWQIWRMAWWGCQRRFLCSVEVKSVLMAALSLALKDCASVVLLYGSMTGMPSFFNEAGSCSTGLELPSAAFFASLSTDSLPVMLAWPGTQPDSKVG